MNRPAPRILVVDDDREIARIVAAYLEQAGMRVLQAHDGETALHNLRREPIDLVVLDLMLPDRDGWEITRILRADPMLAAIPIIMLTARVEEVDKVQGLELGADDYVSKPFSPRLLLARVRALLRRAGGELAPESELLRWGDLSLDLGAHELQLAGRPVELTPTELRILAVFLGQPGQVFEREDLVARALGHDYEGMGRSLDSHIKNLRRKIEADPARPSRIVTVYGIGYKLALGASESEGA
jgi:two-component system alkaline phosphatase synthesis response regulator PhoP